MLSRPMDLVRRLPSTATARRAAARLAICTPRRAASSRPSVREARSAPPYMRSRLRLPVSLTSRSSCMTRAASSSDSRTETRRVLSAMRHASSETLFFMPLSLQYRVVNPEVRMDDEAQSAPSNWVSRSLDYCYDSAVSSNLGGFQQNCDQLAEEYMKQGRDRNGAIDNLIGWQCAKTGLTGFASGLPGILALPFTVPADLGSGLIIRSRR